MVGQTPEFVERFNAAFARHGFATFAGPYDNADVRTLMQACDYVLIPSTWWENSPVVIQEGLRRGPPGHLHRHRRHGRKSAEPPLRLHFRINDAADLAASWAKPPTKSSTRPCAAACPK